MNTLQFIRLKTTWLDEVAEGLKLVLRSLESYKNMVYNSGPDRKQYLMGRDPFLATVDDLMSYTCYTVGVISSLLINIDSTRS